MMPALANHLWQSTAFAAAAGLLAFALRKNRAQARYWLWLIASLKFLVPFSWIVALGSLLAPSTAVPAAQPEFSVVVNQISQPFTAPSAPIAVVHATMNPVPTILLVIWLCGFLVVAFRWWRQWRRIHAAVHSAEPLALKAGVQVLSSPALLEPGIFGIFRPVLLLPEGIADHLTRAQMQAILAHELCHVRRRDNLAAALHMLVEAIFWFYPLVWWIGARLVEERERACDEEVLRLGNEPEVYAESILKTCEFYLESPLTCMSGVTGSDLKKRIVRIMTQRAGQRVGFARKALLAGVGAMAIAGPLALGLMNEGRAQALSGEKSKFEVASIKLNKSGGNVIGMTRSPGSIAIRDCPLKVLIEEAYAVKDYQLSDGPHWIDTDKYDIAAKVNGKANFSQKMRMLQALLADRFQLKMHRRVKSMRVYSLVVSKGGPKLRPPDKTRDRHSGLRITYNKLIGYGAPMRQLAWGLSGQLNRPVVDRTGLRGKFDFALKYAPDNKELAESSSKPSGPSLFTAIQEQLGLKLKPGKGPVEVFVIDHVERPSPN